MVRGRTVPTVLVLLFFVFSTSALKAQLNRGTIEGTLTDPQGAVVPGVQVTITSIETGISQSLKTNGAGYYRAESLVPGTYRASFSASGFERVDVTNIEVIAVAVIRVDAALKLGSARQTVNVSAASALLETSASNYTSTVSSNIVQEIPLAGRDLQQLAFLLPGVNSVAGPPGSNFGFNSQYATFPDPTHVFGGTLSVNGGQAGANAWYLDGNLNMSSFGVNEVVNPTPDTVAEFQAITNAFSAQYGATGGAIFNIVLKSGTNQLHGDLYAYDRNSVFNARNPFTSIDSFGKIIPQDQLRFNNFGGTLGGPVVIPHVYNGKNRTFFFVSWDATILHLLGSQTFTVPTPLMRTGDFSEDPSVAQYGLYDPASSAGPNAQGLFDRTAFGTPLGGDSSGCLASHIAASGGASCQLSTSIPKGRLDPVAMFYINSFPQPNYLSPLSGCPLATGGAYRICSNYLAAVGSSQDSQVISAKIDHQWSDKSKYFFEVVDSPGSYNNYRLPWTGPTFPQPLTGFNSSFPFSFYGMNIGVGNTYSFSPSTVNEFRVNFSRQYLTTHPAQPFPNSISDQSGVEQVIDPVQVVTDPNEHYPSISVGSPGYMTWGLTPFVDEAEASEAYTFLDDLTHIAGKHTLRAGLMYRLNHAGIVEVIPTILSFSGSLATNPITSLGGDGLAQFMMGAVPNDQSGFTGEWGSQPYPYTRWREWGLYVQDDYRVRPNLTLNIGLRWDLNGYFRSRGPMSNICLSCPNPTTALPGLMVFQGSPQIPAHDDFYPPNYNSFAPRFNFAWSPSRSRKTVIRGGYDMFYSNALDNVNSPAQTTVDLPGVTLASSWADSWYPQCAPYSGECVAWPLSNTTVPKWSLANPPLYPGEPPPAVTRQPLIAGSHGYDVFLKAPHDPVVEQWTLEIEHQFTNNLVLTVGYVGNHGSHLPGAGFQNLNFVSTANKLKYQSQLYSEVPISQYYSGQAAYELGQVYANPLTGQPATTLPLSTLLLPWPDWSGGLYSTSSFMNGASDYDGLNVRLVKRLSHGFDFNISYTFSKLIELPTTGVAGSMTVDPIHLYRPGGLGGRVGALAPGAVSGNNYQIADDTREDRTIAGTDIPQILNILGTYNLPFGRGRAYFTNSSSLVNGIIGGWKLTGNFNAEAGLPMAIYCPSDQLTSRCDVIGNPKAVSGGQNADHWINGAAFQPAFGPNTNNFWANYDPSNPVAWQWGTSGPYLPQLRSPGFWNVDTALAKEFHLNEARYFQFRWEAYNALNHQNQGSPNSSFCLAPGPGGETDLVHQAGCQFGRITNVQTDPRAMEFSLKFVW